MSIREEALQAHRVSNGKLQIAAKIPLNNKHDLALAYTPGVAEPCKEIAKDKEKAYEYTIKGNTVAILTNGTAVLGLGNIGPEGGLPVIEGKALLLKEFGNVNAFPICIDSLDPDEIVRTVQVIAPGFGGIHLEDIKAPECFYIEDKLKETLNIPVYHDDQHGTAVAVLAGLYNAMKIVDKALDGIRIVINGAGASGIAIAKLLLAAGAKHIVLCDIDGAISENAGSMNEAQERIAKVTNRDFETGTLDEIIKGKDVFIGVSVEGVLTKEMVQTMNPDSIVFALANPVPEIMPEDAYQGGARIVATGRSDFPNQINNLLVFPGIFRGALEARARDITDEMKLAAAQGIAGLVKDEERNEHYIVPDAFDKSVSRAVSEAVIRIARAAGAAGK
ncbi:MULTISPECIES: NAD(P)-dependent malic enzyme [Paenibacillus]|uniref:Glutamate/Leucine/Phenylalanine/Valine dehydrogenase family protein n=1 Tax=Paenibacillus macerans TaxID=44252 RepID=A0A090ZLF7_PAEMA|nr:NADP-dependent malic enzyme [Paenibacillus macerans]KFN12204.1 glutamate/Leucine/Phenylalanine/Valine dehydrogenase family protein [Paenibacillus macerans]MCY7558376.1 NADP-dependent malic enzyme [Paenibacillus macerans]MEC0150361.1 NADP-dependent malic enzyme [Paenibacillus macerans]MUG23607.1 NAD-dependent malic enzyme [Paenibacillus macerans]SUA84296.1 NAD-dependent malic enzyme 4 [Paenibacillus macerans]